MKKVVSIRKYSASIIWTFVLLLLFFMDSNPNATSLCLFQFVGFPSCFGCGIGHAIHYALHLNISASINEHLIGIPAALGIIYSIIKPIFNLK